MAGAVVAGVMELKNLASTAIKETGQFAQSIARLDGDGLAQAFETANRNIPIFGDLIADASQEIRGLITSISATARSLSQYDGQLAASQARADVAQIVGDIKRAQMLSSGLSQLYGPHQ